MRITGTKRGSSRCGAAAVVLVMSATAAVAPSHAEESADAHPSSSAEPTPSPSPTEPSPSPTEAGTPDSSDGAADETDEGRLANLDIDASLDKDTYNAGDAITLSLTMTNTGDTDLGPLQLTDGAWEVDWYPDRIGDTNLLDAEISIAAGETYERDFTGNMDVVRDEQLDLKLRIRADDGHSRVVELSAQVEMTSGDFSGDLYADRNDNGTFDPGEELADVKVVMSGGIPLSSRRQWTGPDGSFAFSGIPTGVYTISFEEADGWVVPEREKVRVSAAGDPHVTYRAVRPLAESLDLSIRFAQGSYGEGDPVEVDVTLTNTGTMPLTGIRVDKCVDIPTYVQPDDEGWDPVFEDDEGVSLSPGASTVVTVTSEIPERGLVDGVMTIACDFTADGYVGLGTPYIPSGLDFANVGGLTATIDSQFLRDDGNPESGEGEPIPGVRVDVVSLRTGEVVGTAVSDRDGRFVVTVPTNVYDLRVHDGWLFAVGGEPTRRVVVRATRPGERYYELVGGRGDDSDRNESGRDGDADEPGSESGTVGGDGDVGGGGPESGTNTLPDTGSPTSTMLLLGCGAVGFGLLAVASRRSLRSLQR